MVDSLSWIIFSLDLAENNVRNKHKGMIWLFLFNLDDR